MKRTLFRRGAVTVIRRRPAPAIVIAVLALFVALSGTAYAATGGSFILGKSLVVSRPDSGCPTHGS